MTLFARCLVETDSPSANWTALLRRFLECLEAEGHLGPHAIITSLSASEISDVPTRFLDELRTAIAKAEKLMRENALALQTQSALEREVEVLRTQLGSISVPVRFPAVSCDRDLADPPNRLQVPGLVQALVTKEEALLEARKPPPTSDEAVAASGADRRDWEPLVAEVGRLKAEVSCIWGLVRLATATDRICSSCPR